jgi:predicted HTH transcriptional regulator
MKPHAGLTVSFPTSATGVEDAVFGGISDPRNITLIKLFGMVNLAERAGTGVSGIYAAWAAEGWKAPVLEEQFNPDRTVLSLDLSPQNGDKTAIKSGDKIKTAINLRKKQEIINYLHEHPSSKSKELAELLGINVSRTKVYLRELFDDGAIVPEGANRNRTYRLSAKT